MYELYFFSSKSILSLLFSLSLCLIIPTDVTMLLGAAALLKKMENEIVGTVRLVFQPAEEGGAGMKRMVEEGVVGGGDNDKGLLEAQLAFGMHVWPG